MTKTEPQLARTLSGIHLWGIAVGLVISGEYFGWSYGWAQAGTLGFLISTVFIALMYTTFIFSYTELTTAIPHAGGPFAYSYRAFGPVGGYIAGFSTLVEFVFAPPAIALAIGAYLNVQFPALDARVAAVGAYIVFMAIFAGAAGDWRTLANINDPLPQAMKIVVGARSGWLHLLVWIGLLGLIASFHGIIMGYSRQIFALARAGFLPGLLARIHPRWKTPHLAILAGGAVGIAAIYSDKVVTIAGQPLTASIVAMSALGAIVMYIMSLLSLFRLRRREPQLPRPYRTPLFPIFPWTALIIACVSLVAIVYFNPEVSGLFAFLGLLGGAIARRQSGHRALAANDPMLCPTEESRGG